MTDLPGRLRRAALRYLPAELVGTMTMILAALAVQRWGSDELWAVTLAAVIGESVGFYIVMAWSVVREEWPHTAGLPHRSRRTTTHSFRLLVAEFGPAEIVDSFTRPPLTAAALWMFGSDIGGLLIAKVFADAMFYAIAGGGYASTYWWGWRRRPAAESPTLRARRLEECRSLVAEPDVELALATRGTPLLVLEPARVEAAYRRLCAALPDVRFHYAVKALDHPAVIEAVAKEGGWFDVAGSEELALVLGCGVAPERVIHTHPIKTPAQIRDAVSNGVRVFVVDSPVEVDKFVDIAVPGVRVLVRLAYPNRQAHSDLSSKFGVDPAEAQDLVAYAARAGVTVAGFSFHVGSQLDAVSPFVLAVERTLDLMASIEKSTGRRFEILDIGGGFPVDYLTEAVPFEEIASAIAPLLATRCDLTVIAEPGRVVVADAMTLVSRVVGVGERWGRPWFFLDDGVYGSWSPIIFEQVRAMILTEPELRGEPRETVTATVAGPTCDSTDVVATAIDVPRLEVGELVVSPTMGAYTAVTSTRFNGRAPAEILVLASDQAGNATAQRCSTARSAPVSKAAASR